MANVANTLVLFQIRYTCSNMIATPYKIATGLEFRRGNCRIEGMIYSLLYLTREKKISKIRTGK